MDNLKNPARQQGRKSRQFLPVLFLLVSLLQACEKVPDFQQVEPQVFVQCLYTRQITLEETSRALMEQYGVTEEMLEPYRNQVDLFFSLRRYYNAHAITYRTISPEGHPVIASGMVYYPLNRRPAGLVEVSPINKSKINCATEECFTAEILPIMVEGYACIVPDLIGCGTTAELPISYLQHENTAVVSADLRRAAAEFLWNEYAYRLEAGTILYGYSLGGACAFSLARYYQQHPELGVEVTDIFGGGGVYDPLLAVEAQLADDRSDYATIPNILFSLNYYDQLELDPQRLFKGPLLEHWEEWCDGYLPIPELTRRIGTKPSAYLSDELLHEFKTSPYFAPLIRTLQSKAIPLDRVPQARVHLFHSAADYFVPTACGDRFYEELKAAGADVTYTKYEYNHVASGLLVEIDFIKFLHSRH